jgi:hypothetical protein
MKRAEFMYTVGFDGDTAIIDGKAKRKYGKLSTLQLAEAGQYKAAFCSAIYSGDEEEMNQLLRYLSEHTELPADSPESLKRLFGVFGVREDIRKTMYV